MSAKNLDFNCALVTGGGGGIGRGISEWLISLGKRVIIVGRTESTLATTAKEIGASAYYTLDTGDIASIPNFVKKLLSEHPEVDCLINNAGVQRPLQVQKQSAEDFLSKADNEIDINIRGPLHLTLNLLDHFKSKPSAVVVNVSSILGYIPISIINPVYNGTKAWLHFWTMTLRTQLEGTSVKIIEIAPPTVSTDLHRERENPDDNKKEANSAAMSVQEFIEEVSGKWMKGEETIGAGPGAKTVDKWMGDFGKMYEEMKK